MQVSERTLHEAYNLFRNQEFRDICQEVGRDPVVEAAEVACMCEEPHVSSLSATITGLTRLLEYKRGVETDE